MGNRINYKEGEIVGSYGIAFIKELPVYIDGEKRIRRALFMCKCGAKFRSRIYNIKANTTKTCGCSRINNQKMLKHGMKYSKLYNTWVLMNGRCYNKNNKNYHYYGGCGITVCVEWRDDFKAFYDYVSALPYYGEPGRSLDRFPNNDGNYEPMNVRWATLHQQAVNKGASRNNTSGYVGVWKNGTGYCTWITVNGVRTYIGFYKIKEEAVTARNNYIIKNNLTEYKIQEINA